MKVNTPEMSDLYYFINDRQEIESCLWAGMDIDHQRLEEGNYYETKEEIEHEIIKYVDINQKLLIPNVL